MSDFTISGVTASGNVTVPQDIPIDGAVDIILTVTVANTIVYPITISAQITVKTETAIDFPSVVGPEILDADPIELIIPVITTAVTQVGAKVNQNYLVTITDSDARTQEVNIATPEFTVEAPDNPDGYPSVIAVGP